MHHDLLQQQIWLQMDMARLDEDRKASIKRKTADILALADSHSKQVSAIKADQELSQTGRDSRLRSLAVKTRATLDGLTVGSLAELDREIVEAESAAARALAGQADDASRTLLKVEVRQLATRFDTLLLPFEYLKLCRSGADDLSCQALEEAPAFAQRLKPETLSEGKALRAARLLPDRMEALRQVREMRNQIASTRAAAMRELSEFLPDPLVEMAKGKAATV